MNQTEQNNSETAGPDPAASFVAPARTSPRRLGLLPYWIGSALLALGLLAWTCGGCDLTIDGESVFKHWRDEPEQQDQGEGIGEIDDAAPRRDYDADAESLAIWRDPEFNRRFTESYLSETDVEPKVQDKDRENLQRLQQLRREDRIDEAISLVETVRGKDSSPVFDYILGNLYYEKNRLEDAASALKVATARFPKFRRAWKQLGVVYFRLEQYHLAIKSLTRASELGAADATTYGLLGFSHQADGNPISAEAAYRMAILLAPDTLDWKRGLAQSFFNQQRYAEAAAVCESLLEKNPDDVALWEMQANAYIGMDQPLKAAYSFEMVDSMGKSSFEILATLGDIYINQQRYEVGLDAYLRALKKFPDAAPDKPIHAARVLAARGAQQETQTLLARIEEVHGQDLKKDQRRDLLMLQARTAILQDQGGKHEELLLRVIELNPMDGQAMITLGRYYRKQDKISKAIHYYTEAAGIEEFEADAKLRLAELYVGQREYDKAIPLLKQSLAKKNRPEVQQFLERVERFARRQ
jgi:tetratricopeptide (TPR) repeat protein